MEPAILGLVLDSSVPVAADRKKTHYARRNSQAPRSRRRRHHRDLFACRGGTCPQHFLPVTESTAEIIARIGAWQAAKGINLPLTDLIIGACALELGYAIGTVNIRDFNRIPGLSIIRF